MTSFRYSADHTGFFRDEKTFFPKIQAQTAPLHSWSDVVVLRLPAALKDDLDWSQEKKRASMIIEAGKAILWDIDFQFAAHKNLTYDTAAFFSYARALEEWVRFTAPYSQHTFGICLHRGSADFSSLFDRYRSEEAFYDWLGEFSQNAGEGHELKHQKFQEEWMQSSGGEHYFSLFQANLFAEYLHRLISFLPDGLLVFALLDIRSAASSAQLAQLLSRERFQHFHLGLQGARWPFGGISIESGPVSWGWMGKQDSLKAERQTLPNLALYLPSDPYCDRKVLSGLESLMEMYRSQDVSFRIICEEKLTEEWEGLDRLVVISESVSPQGKRKMQGFCAAGGEITYSSLCNLKENI